MDADREDGGGEQQDGFPAASGRHPAGCADESAPTGGFYTAVGKTDWSRERGDTILVVKR